MRGLVYVESRDKVDVDTFHKGIEYALEKLGKSKFGFERTGVSNFKSKRHEGSGNKLQVGLNSFQSEKTSIQVSAVPKMTVSLSKPTAMVISLYIEIITTIIYQIFSLARLV